MKRRSILGGLGAMGTLALTGCGGPTYTNRFRLTVEIDTPQGLRSGSSVIEINYRDDTKTWAPVTAQKLQVSMKGEAVFVDLGQGKHVIALLASGPTAQDGLDEIVRISFGTRPIEQYASYQNETGARLVPAETQPSLITFTDLTDPASAKVIYATGRHYDCVPPMAVNPNCQPRDLGPFVIDRFAETFGPGYALKGIAIQMTSDPITKGIEGKVVGLMDRGDWDKKVAQWADRTRPHPAATSSIPAVGSGNFIRNF